MKMDKISISFDAALGNQVRNAARKAGIGISSWLAGAAATRLQSEGLSEFIDAWENKHGVLTAAELNRAELELGTGTVRTLRR